MENYLQSEELQVKSEEWRERMDLRPFLFSGGNPVTQRNDLGGRSYAALASGKPSDRKTRAICRDNAATTQKTEADTVPICELLTK